MLSFSPAGPGRLALPLALAGALAAACSGPSEPGASGPSLIESPQYLGVRLAGGDFLPRDTPANRARCGWPDGLPFVGNDTFCVLISQDLPARIPDPTARREVMARGFQEIRDAVLGGAPELPGRRLAIEASLDVLAVAEADQGQLEAYLDDLLATARRVRVALVVNLDTVNWLRGRPDVYGDPANVEATFSEPAWISWRNWGQQIRVGTPPPNLAATGFRAAVATALRRLLPHLSTFYAALAPEERDLVGGLVFGTELSIGLNAYYYPGGNALLSSRPECDPGTPRRADCPGPPPAGPCGGYNQNVCLRGCTASSGNVGGEQLGYAAARTSGLLGPGERITRPVLDRIVSDYVRFLGGLAAEAGAPSHKVIAHIGICAPDGPHALTDGRAGGLVPAATLYEYAADPAGLLAGHLETSPELARLPWASPEWFFAGGRHPGAAAWASAIEATAGYLNNRMLILANWETVRGDPDALAGLRRALTVPTGARPAVTPAIVLGTAPFRGPTGAPLGVGVSTSRRGPGATWLLASTRPDLGWDGLLATPDVASEPLASGASRILALPAGGAVHVQLVTDDVAGRRIASPVVALPIPAGATGGEVPYPRLFSDAAGGRATFSWDLGGAAGPARLQLSRDPTFAAVDGLDQDVSGLELLTTRALAPGTWYARLLQAPAGAASAASNVVEVRVSAP